MINKNHTGPHCAGLCEGAAYISTIKRLSKAWELHSTKQEIKIKRLEAEIERLKPYYHAIDEACVVAHLGTAESFKSAKEALDAAVTWIVGANKYFEEQKTDE